MNLIQLVKAVFLVSLCTGNRSRIPVLRYEDSWVCVNKPAGLTVHKSDDRRSHGVTLRSSLKRQLARKVLPVHRLDHRTSGAIVFAFDSETAGSLHDALARGTKDYIAIVRGIWRHQDPFVVDEPLNVKGVKKEAATKFSLLASSTESDDFPFSILRCQPLTGRTHQIRRHAYHAGHPIIGDSQHGDSRVNRQWRTNRGLDRMGLHCLEIKLDGVDGACVAPLSPELRTVLEARTSVWELAVERDPRLALEQIDLRGGTFGRNYRNRRATEAPHVENEEAVPG